ncbi:MAG: LysM peptidoglycan-binding domain-containing protein [Chlamydiota bacterium]
MKHLILYFAAFALLSACSPIRSSPHDEKHQMELTLHEVQTNLDDLRHDIHSYQTEIQILDGRIKYYENALTCLKQQDIEKQYVKIDQLSEQLHALEKKWNIFENWQNEESGNLKQLLFHSKETTAALSQFKDRIQELEQDILLQNRRFEELAKLKGTIETLAKGGRSSGDAAKIYKVRSGDSLEKIARFHKVPVERIKKLNGLDQDLIVIGQELKIPNE